MNFINIKSVLLQASGVITELPFPSFEHIWGREETSVIQRRSNLLSFPLWNTASKGLIWRLENMPRLAGFSFLLNWTCITVSISLLFSGSGGNRHIYLQPLLQMEISFQPCLTGESHVITSYILINNYLRIWKHWGPHLWTMHFPSTPPFANCHRCSRHICKRDVIFSLLRSSTINLLSSVLGTLPTPRLWDQI